MKTKDVFAYYKKAFGSDSLVILASRLGVQRQRVHYWKNIDLMPENIAFRVEQDTRGALKVNPADYGWVLAPEISK